MLSYIYALNKLPADMNFNIFLNNQLNNFNLSLHIDSYINLESNWSTGYVFFYLETCYATVRLFRLNKWQAANGKFVSFLLL